MAVAGKIYTNGRNRLCFKLKNIFYTMVEVMINSKNIKTCSIMLGAELFHCNGNKNVIELWSIFNKTKSFFCILSISISSRKANSHGFILTGNMI